MQLLPRYPDQGSLYRLYSGLIERQFKFIKLPLMAQHKKKPGKQQMQKLLSAQYRNEFFRRLQFVINSHSGGNNYSRIPPKILDFTFKARFHPLKLVQAKGCRIPEGLMREAGRDIPVLVKLQTICLLPASCPIPLSDFFTVVLSVNLINAQLKEGNLIQARSIREAVDNILLDAELYQRAYRCFYFVLLSYCICKSELGKCLYWMKHEVNVSLEPPLGFENIVTVHSVQPESVQLNIDGNIRPAIRVGWAFPFDGIQWCGLKPSLFNPGSSGEDEPMKVYIQSHALNRLAERIDCFSAGSAQYNMWLSLDQPKVCLHAAGHILIEFRFYDVKAGYFLAEIVNGAIMIRTFLFLTQGGTPEGEILIKNTGLKKLDLKYLAIDKLSSFISSDISDNEEVRNIFTAAGCQSLMDLHAKLSDLCTKQSRQSTARLILRYLKKADPVLPLNLTEGLSAETLRECSTALHYEAG